jgi:hypothetical protein
VQLCVQIVVGVMCVNGYSCIHMHLIVYAIDLHAATAVHQQFETMCCLCMRVSHGCEHSAAHTVSYTIVAW